MKSTGIIRKVDELGRIVIPAELREHFGINTKDKLEISTDGDRIVLRKASSSCIFCGTADNVTVFGNKLICESCIARIKEAL